MKLRYECPTCGKPFYKYPSQSHRFCSRGCKRQPHPKSLQERFWERVVTGENCWDWSGAHHSGGYGQIGDIAHSTSPLLAHRVSWEMHYGPIPEGMDVLHQCDNPPCTRPAHLFLGTAKDNTQDMIRKGRRKQGHFRNVVKGESHHAAKLTEDDVRAIRASVESRPTIAARYGIHPDHVKLVQKRKRWKHVA